MESASKPRRKVSVGKFEQPIGCNEWYNIRTVRNKLLIAGLVVFFGLLISGPVLALSASDAADIRNALKKLVPQRTEFSATTLNSISGTTLSVTANNTIYTVRTDGSTILLRKFGGKSALAEMSPGDVLNIIGKWTDSSQTIIQAKLIRDKSIQKRNGTFFGHVAELTSTGWTMTTEKRGIQTVTVSSSTKFTDKREKAIFRVDVKIGDLVRVRGLWDDKLNTITLVSQVKDFSLPVKTTSFSATPSAQ